MQLVAGHQLLELLLQLCSQRRVVLLPHKLRHHAPEPVLRVQPGEAAPHTPPLTPAGQVTHLLAQDEHKDGVRCVIQHAVHAALVHHLLQQRGEEVGQQSGPCPQLG